MSVQRGSTSGLQDRCNRSAHVRTSQRAETVETYKELKNLLTRLGSGDDSHCDADHSKDLKLLQLSRALSMPGLIDALISG